MKALWKRIVVRGYKLTPKPVRARMVRLLTPNFTAGVMTLLVRDNGDVLFLKSTYRQGWGLPGGHMGRNEQPEDSARREVFEELGIDVEVPKPYRVAVVPELQSVTFLTLVRVTDEQAAAIRIDPVEVAAVQWFSAAAMPELDEEIAPLSAADREAVAAALAAS